MVPDLPVGREPGWESQDPGEEGVNSTLQSISESSVILQSLRQSREIWLSSAFLKFSSKARGPKPEIVPPPHTLRTKGKCDVEIGPHVFEIWFYEAHYLPPQAPSGVSQPAHIYQPTTNWQSTAPYSSSYVPYGQRSATPVPVPTSSDSSSSAPLLSSLTAVTTITPSLINQVNQAAASNPTLANLLQLAAAGKATPEQLKTLGLLIQSLAAPEVAAASASTSAPTASTSQPLPPPSSEASVKEFDLVLQFQETSSDRWIIPRGPAVCERIIDSRVSDAAYDILFTASLSLSNATQQPSEEIVTLRFRHAPLSVWDSVNRWIGGEEKMKENKRLLDQLKRQDRVYLAYQLAPSPLHTQLQAADASGFTMKSLKPGPLPVSRPKRKPAAPRKAAEGTVIRKKPAERPGLLSTAAPVPLPIPPVPKKRKVANIKPVNIMPQIRCLSCGQTDVPLILGGRFCRPCVDAGKASEIPQTHRFSSYVPKAQFSPQTVAAAPPVFIPSDLSANAPTQPPSI